MSAYGVSSVVNRGVSVSPKDDAEAAPLSRDRGEPSQDTSKPEVGSASKTRLPWRRDPGLTNPLASIARLSLLAGVLAVVVILIYTSTSSQSFSKESTSLRVSQPVFSDSLPSVLVSDKVLHTMLEAAEEQYKANVAARLALNRGVLRAAKVDVREVKADWLVPLYPCSLESRLGLWGEGGKWLCLRHHAMRRPPLVISVGSRGDQSFEEDIASRLGGFSHTFDFSLTPEEDEKMQSYPFLKFYKLGLWGSTQKDYYLTRFPNSTFVTVPQMLKTVGASYVDILKIDCEGCEHRVVVDMAALYTSETVPFGQILMEVHWIGTTDVLISTLLSLEKLGYRMFHTEVNAYWDQGYEIALIHEKLIDPKL